MHLKKIMLVLDICVDIIDNNSGKNSMKRAKRTFGRRNNIGSYWSDVAFVLYGIYVAGISLQTQSINVIFVL